MVHTLGELYIDFAKQHVDQNAISELIKLADRQRFEEWRRALYAGEVINHSEDRAVLHMALREGAPNAPDNTKQAVKLASEKMYAMVNDIHHGHWAGYTGQPIRDVVHIGIGGSHLGPELAVTALVDHHQVTAPNIHFVANIDAYELTQVLAQVKPETTLFIIVSKSFSTLETQMNAQSARSWFLERTNRLDAIQQHFIAVTTNLEAASAFGLREDRLLPLWDWAGGRFSLWSSAGIPIALALGVCGFQELLAGAQQIDQHFFAAPSQTNIPLLQALFAAWNNNVLGTRSLAVLSYDERLRLLPDYLQQLEMESNGKSVDRFGSALKQETMNVVWGGTGTKGQHAYHQLLHQGTQPYAADFLLVGTDRLDHPQHHHWLNANALAQSQAMANGYQPASTSEQHRTVLGNHPSTTIILKSLTPKNLGALLAIYEHKVFCQGVLWGINSFDQWGVELGKRLAIPIHNALIGHQQTDTFDAATQGPIKYLKSIRDHRET